MTLATEAQVRIRAGFDRWIRYGKWVGASPKEVTDLFKDAMVEAVLNP